MKAHNQFCHPFLPGEVKADAETGQQKKAQGLLYCWNFLFCVEKDVFPLSSKDNFLPDGPACCSAPWSWSPLENFVGQGWDKPQEEGKFSGRAWCLEDGDGGNRWADPAPRMDPGHVDVDRHPQGWPPQPHSPAHLCHREDNSLGWGCPWSADRPINWYSWLRIVHHLC